MVNACKPILNQKALLFSDKYHGMHIAYYDMEVHNMVYECVVKKGHTGAGKYLEQKIFVHANNILEAMDAARQAGGVKKGKSNNSGQSVMEVREVPKN
jgi:hypothetical protein